MVVGNLDGNMKFNKRFFKKTLLVIGIILISFFCIASLVENDFDLFEFLLSFIDAYVDFVAKISELYENLLIIGCTCLIISLFIDGTGDKQKLLKKYKLLFGFGFVPFIIFIIYILICMEFKGGFKLFIELFKFISYIVWPIYLIELVVIFYSLYRLLKLKNNKK